MTNTDMDVLTLIRLNDFGIIDDKAFTEAIKKLHTKATPYNDKAVDSSSADKNTKAFNEIGDKIKKANDKTRSDRERTDDARVAIEIARKYVNTNPSPYTATYTPEQSNIRGGGATGVYKPDLFSGSILKPEQPCGGYGKTFSTDSFHLCDKSKREIAPPLTDSDWELAMKGVLDMLAQPAKKVEVIAYSENRTLVPEHAKQVLEWIDEAWTKKVDEYNSTKDKWKRVQYKDKDGKEVVEWIDVSTKSNKEAEDYEKWLSEDVVVEGDDAELNGLKHIFNLSITGSEC